MRSFNNWGPCSAQNKIKAITWAEVGCDKFLATKSIPAPFLLRPAAIGIPNQTEITLENEILPGQKGRIYYK